MLTKGKIKTTPADLEQIRERRRQREQADRDKSGRGKTPPDRKEHNAQASPGY